MPGHCGRAEELGFDHAWTYDHLAWRNLRDSSCSGLSHFDRRGGCHRAIRLGTLVASPTFRHPVPFAKELITLDDVSSGRLTLGIGAGSSRGWDSTCSAPRRGSLRERSDGSWSSSSSPTGCCGRARRPMRAGSTRRPRPAPTRVACSSRGSRSRSPRRAARDAPGGAACPHWVTTATPGWGVPRCGRGGRVVEEQIRRSTRRASTPGATGVAPAARAHRPGLDGGLGSVISKLSTAPAGSFANASFVGANTVNALGFAGCPPDRPLLQQRPASYDRRNLMRSE